jgi:hypothetical protein
VVFQRLLEQLGVSPELVGKVGEDDEGEESEKYVEN